MKAVIYARYSSHSQTEQSIEGQLRDCRAFAEREDILVIGEYIDRALTGRYDDRPDFLRMIADSRKRQFDYVIVWKLDRFARNRYDSAIYKYKLRQNGVRVLSAMENIGEGDESIILEAVLEASAEYYSRDLSKKVKRGQRETALKGGYIGGTAPFGYKVIDKRVVIDEERMPYIKRAFEQYADGVPKREIMRRLAEKGVRGRDGASLSLTSFQHALKNPKYTGEYEFNGIIMHNYPQIIEKELFERVQNRLRQNARAPAAAKAKIDYLLQGKANCGLCGARMVGESGRGKSGEVYHYYACGQRKKLHNCAKANEKKDFIEWYVVEQTIEFILDPARIDYIAEAVVAEYNKEFNDEAVSSLERRVAKIDRDIDSAVDLMIENRNKELRKRTEKRIEELTNQKEDLSIELAKISIANGIRYTVEEISVWLRQFRKGDLMDAEFRRRVIDVFINSVYLYDDKIVIFYNIKNGRQVSFIGVSAALEGSEVPDENGEVYSESVRISTPPSRHSSDSVS
ncbi:MAG: recombinase family protein [Oscillospiraceae bacterium]|jgi:DNA invertase Pin-like site-specific DNA recombinase|nr:recombinase family protein [Oscillospiraceae bacterium]